jgi:Na+/H+ antiporter NhaD/arsenite permease-like protein
MATFLLSMVITNDVPLVVVVPLTMLLDVPFKGSIVILEALAANAGSALTPFGNPQNLFIYWHYHVNPLSFVLAILPFSLFFALVLAIASIRLGRGERGKGTEEVKVEKNAFVYIVLLLVLVLVVLRIFPIWTGVAVLLYAASIDLRSLKIDYFLLVTFLCFFGVADNLKVMLPSIIARSKNTFLISALVSQVISNVPAAILLADFTSKWKALLWVTNVGGFGSLVGSLANLIAYKLYLSSEDGEKHLGFTLRFLGLGYLFFFMGALLYRVLF